MTSQPGKQTFISKSKDNQTIKIDHLIENYMRSIFLEKSYTKYGGKTSTRPRSKKSILIIFLDH